MSGLYEAILAKLDFEFEHVTKHEALPALKAVVERHNPEPCGWPGCRTEGHTVCAACGRSRSHPCQELELIAEKLGITEGHTS